MKAVTWCGTRKVSVDNVPDPQILNPRDAIVKITSTCICGSDLHLYDGYIPTMQKGDVLGHEFMGEVVEVGSGVNAEKVKVGDRVIVPFCIACGNCFYCKRQLFSCCDNSNPNAWLGEKAYGFSTAGLFGYSHLTGGYAGGQAEYARVPFADHQLFKVPETIPDEQAVFLTDIFPTGYMAAEQCNIQKGDVVAVWGCGPVGQFAIRSAALLGAHKVVAIDDGTRVPERLRMAADGGAITIDMRDEYVYEKLLELTGGRGPDACIDAVGMEAHGLSVDAILDKVKPSVLSDRPGPRPAASHQLLPQGRHPLHPRRLWRLRRQVPHLRRHAEGPDLQDGPDPRPQVRPAPDRPHPARRDRPQLRHHPQAPPRPGGVRV